MAPLAWRSMTGSTCLQVRKTLFRLKSTCASQTSSAHFDRAAMRRTADIVDQHVDAGRKRSRQACTIDCDRSAVGDVAAAASTISPPDFFTRATVSVRRCRDRGRRRISCAPSSAKRTAVARPLPQPGPTRAGAGDDGDAVLQTSAHDAAAGQCGAPARSDKSAADCPPAAPGARRRRARSRRGYPPARRRRARGGAWLGCGQSVPQTHAVAEFRHQLAGEGHSVGIRRALSGRPVGHRSPSSRCSCPASARATRGTAGWSQST